MIELGPLPQINTAAAAVGLDIKRALNYKRGVTMQLVRKDGSVLGGWASVATISRGWCRVGIEERGRGQGYTVRFKIADLTGQLVEWLAGEDRATHALVDGVYHEIVDVPKVPPDRAQVYNIESRTPTLVRASP